MIFRSAYIGSLVEFSFISSATPGLPQAALLRLAQQAASANSRRGLTGELRFADGRFTQVIEGTSDAILPLVARILTDRRHEQIAVTSLGPISTRRFTDWTNLGFAAAPASAATASANLCLMPLIAAFVRPGAAVAVRGASIAP